MTERRLTILVRLLAAGIATTAVGGAFIVLLLYFILTYFYGHSMSDPSWLRFAFIGISAFVVCGIFGALMFYRAYTKSNKK